MRSGVGVGPGCRPALPSCAIVGWVVAGTLLIPAAGARADGPRQSGSVRLSSETPATVTALAESAHYVNPSDPAAKPPPVTRIVVRYPDGFRIDTSAPERCTASDSEIEAQGSAACPPGSRVGEGGAEFATGFPAPGDTFAVDFELFNAADQIIFVARSHGQSQVLSVSRSTIDGATLTSDVPALPGGPPDGRSSVRDIHFNLDAIATQRDGRVLNYLTTPPTCPDSRQWSSLGTFTYSDGVEQSITPTTPCQQAPSGRHPQRTARRRRHHHHHRRGR
jgi:hypothetical protein